MSNLLYWRFSRSLYTYLSIRYAGHRPLAPMIRHFHDDDSGHKDTKRNMRPRVANKDEKIPSDLKLVDSKTKHKISTGTAPKLSIEQEMKALGHVVGSKQQQQNSKDTINLKSHVHANPTPKSTDAKSSSKSSQTVGDQSKDTAVECQSNASAVESRVRAFVDSIESRKASRTTEKQDKSPSPVTTTANRNAVTKLTDKCSQASQTESQKVSSKEGSKTDLKTRSSSQTGVGSTNLFDGKPESSQTKMSQKRSESAGNLADKNVGFKSDPQIPWEGMFGEHFKTSPKGSIEGGSKAVGSKEERSQSLHVVSSKDQNKINDKLSQVEAKPETTKIKSQSAGDRNLQQNINKTKPEPNQSLTKGARSNSLGCAVQNSPKTEAPSTEIKNKTILNPWKTETSSSNNIDKANSNQAQTKDPRCNSVGKTGAELAMEGNSALKSAIPQKEKSNICFKFEHKVSKPVQSQTEIKTAVIKDDAALKDVLKGSNKHDEWIAKILSPPNKGYESSKIKSNTAHKIEDGFSKAMPHQNKSDNKFAPSKTDEASRDKSKIQSDIKPTGAESEKASKDNYSSTFNVDDGFSKANPYQKQPDNKSALNKPSSKFDEATQNKSNSIYYVKSWNSELKQSQNELIKKSGVMKPDEASRDKPNSFNKDGERFHKSKPSQSQFDNKLSADKLDEMPMNKSNIIYKVTDLSSEALPNQSTNKHGANKMDEASNKNLSTPKETSNDLLESFSVVRSASTSDRKFSGDIVKVEKIELLPENTVEEKAFTTPSKRANIQDGFNSDLKYRSSIEKANSYDRKAEIQQSARPQYGLKSAEKTKSTAFGSSQKSNRGTIGSLLQAVRQNPNRQEKAAKGHQEEVVNILKEKIKEDEKKAEFLEIIADELRSRRAIDTTPVNDNKMNPMKSGDAPTTARTEGTSGAMSKDKPSSNHDRELTATIAAAIVKGISESSATSKESDTIAGKSMPIVSLQELRASGQRDSHLTSTSLGNSNSGKTMTSYGKTELIGTDESRIGGKRETNVVNAEPDSKKMDKKFRTDLIVDKGSDNQISKDITCNVRDKSTEKTHKIKAEDITPGVLYNSTTEGENRDFPTNINIEDDDETLRFKAEQFLKESEARQILEKTKHINIEKLDVDKLDVEKRAVAQLDAAKLDANKQDFAKVDVAKPDVAKLDVDKLDVDELDVSAQQKPKPKLTISQYLYEMFMGKRKNNNESGRRNITTYSAVHNRNSRLDNHTESKSKKSVTPYASKKTAETFISPDLAKRQLGKEAILKGRRSKSQESRHGVYDRESRQRFDQFEVSCSKQLVLSQSACMPGISHQKQTLIPTLNDNVILRMQKTESEENLVNFTDDINSTKILGGTPYKCEDKSLRAKLKNKKDKSEIVIKGGSKKCLEKEKDVKEAEDDGECGKRSFGALGRQLFHNLLIYISRIEKKH
ncbi:serine-rich adhesin for platelets isoform X1 [Drosophila virilis]|uniref:Uncharacterized protein n=1 Tax=Drosophila virilis TaxID=7244 RepID=B4LZX0_DROVI|nr:uncharacterized protein LOC6629721 isoform X1 [Drosophila virilis]EDW67198.2 uncharacterized protein Dvir_GJ23220 [Drosophila virilis]